MSKFWIVIIMILALMAGVIDFFLPQFNIIDIGEGLLESIQGALIIMLGFAAFVGSKRGGRR